jgi:hypothetical protein
MARYVYSRERGCMVNRDSGEPMNPEPLAGPFPCPRVVADIQPYLSPVTGQYISGRRAKADDLRRHNCIDASELPRKTDGKLRNRKFAEKRGLTHLLAEDAK